MLCECAKCSKSVKSEIQMMYCRAECNQDCNAVADRGGANFKYKYHINTTFYKMIIFRFVKSETAE